MVVSYVRAAAVIASLCTGPAAFANPLSLLPPGPSPFADAAPALPAQTYSYADPRTDEQPAPANRLRRTVVDFPAHEAAGTIVVDTPHTYLYYVLGNGRAIRYGIGVGREGFTWSGTQAISRKSEWPDWYPPQDMIGRQPYLPRFMAGGPGNPLGARAIYLGNTMFRIHGTNQPETIGRQVSSGCIRLLNEDVIDLYERAKVGGKVIVLPAQQHAEPAARRRVSSL